MAEKRDILKFVRLNKLFDSLTGYLENRLELAKIELREELSLALSKLALIILLSSICFMFIIFASVALSLYLNLILDSSFLGFGMVSAAYLLFFVILVILKRQHKLESIIEKYIEILLKKHSK